MTNECYLDVIFFQNCWICCSQSWFKMFLWWNYTVIHLLFTTSVVLVACKVSLEWRDTLWEDNRMNNRNNACSSKNGMTANNKKNYKLLREIYFWLSESKSVNFSDPSMCAANNHGSSGKELYCSCVGWWRLIPHYGWENVCTWGNT